jgi:hypothetical protein
VAQVWANSTWNSLLYSVPAGNVPNGSAAWQTLTWDQSGTPAWKATSKFTVNDTTGAVTVTGGAGATITAVGFIGALTGNATTATNATTAANCTRTVTGATGVTGGGALTGNQVLSLDTANPRNIDHTTVSMTGGLGLTAASGGDISTTRTFNVGAGTGITVNTDDVALNLTYLATSGSVNNSTKWGNYNIVVTAGAPGTDPNTIYFVTV